MYVFLTINLRGTVKLNSLLEMLFVHELYPKVFL